MNETIKEQVNRATSAAEELIRIVLQEYHDRTGMIPQSVSFRNIDISTHDSERLQVAVSHVTLKATT